MVSTTSRHIWVTIGGFLVTLAAKAGVLVTHVAVDLHEPVTLDSFTPRLVLPALLLELLFGILGAAVAGAVSVLRSPKPPSSLLHRLRHRRQVQVPLSSRLSGSFYLFACDTSPFILYASRRSTA